MTKHHSSTSSPSARFGAAVCGALLVTSACAAEDSIGAEDDAATTASDVTTAEAGTDTEAEAGTDAEASSDTTTAPASTDADASTDSTPVEGTAECDDVAALFVTRGSANADLEDPEVNATCEGDDIVITSNGIPDYTYIETSPGSPTDRGHTFTIPSSPTVADEVTDIPLLGTAAVTLSGIPIFGPTEGTGGDVDSLPGIISECGSHNGPSGFHIHKIMTTSETDCLFSPEEVAAGPQLVGYAFDGFPIYTGIDQYASSWELTDEDLFGTDTWAAHTYVEGSGDLDQCNGLTDADGNYAYYTTATFPYVVGCYTGVVEIEAAGGGGGGGGDGEVDADRPERPEGEAGGEADADRPERPEGEAGGEADADRPERPEDDVAPESDDGE